MTISQHVNVMAPQAATIWVAEMPSVEFLTNGRSHSRGLSRSTRKSIGVLWIQQAVRNCGLVVDTWPNDSGERSALEN